MEVHRQTCQACGARELRNLLVREPGEAQVVLVACGVCRELVARYELAGYYHRGKGFEGWLRHVTPTESSLDLEAAFAEQESDATAQYERALALLEAEERDP